MLQLKNNINLDSIDKTPSKIKSTSWPIFFINQFSVLFTFKYTLFRSQSHILFVQANPDIIISDLFPLFYFHFFNKIDYSRIYFRLTLIKAFFTIKYTKLINIQTEIFHFQRGKREKDTKTDYFYDYCANKRNLLDNLFLSIDCTYGVLCTVYI